MAVNNEEILARLGLDISSIQRSTQIMLDQQKKASMDYVGFWEGAMEKRDQAETAANDRSLAKLKALDEAKLAETERFFAAQRAQYAEQDGVSAVGQGSIPVGWSKGAKEAEKGVETAEKGVGSLRKGGRELRELGHLIGDLTGITAGVMVLRAIIGVFRGWGMTGAAFLTEIPVIGAGVAAYLEMRKKADEMNAAIKISEASDVSIGKDSGRLQKRLTAIVAQLSEQGLLHGPAGAEISRRLSTGGMDNVMFAQRMLQNLFPGVSLGNLGGGEHMTDAAREAARVGMSPGQRWQSDTMELMRSIVAMNTLDKNSALYKAEQLKYEKLLKDQAEDSLAIKKETAELEKQQGAEKKKAQEGEKLREEHLADLERQRQGLIFRQYGEMQRNEMDFPSLEQLARARVWQGGRNPGWVRTGQGQIAHNILELQQDQIHRREWGDVSGANADARQIGMLKGVLQSEGFMAKDTRLDAIHAELRSLNARVAQTLNVNIAAVNGNHG